MRVFISCLMISIAALAACSTITPYQSPDSGNFIHMPHPHHTYPSQVRLHFAKKNLPEDVTVFSTRIQDDWVVSRIKIIGCDNSRGQENKYDFEINEVELRQLKGRYFSINIASSLPADDMCLLRSLNIALLTAEEIPNENHMTERLRKYTLRIDDQGTVTIEHQPQDDKTLNYPR